MPIRWPMPWERNTCAAPGRPASRQFLGFETEERFAEDGGSEAAIEDEAGASAPLSKVLVGMMPVHAAVPVRALSRDQLVAVVPPKLAWQRAGS